MGLLCVVMIAMVDDAIGITAWGGHRHRINKLSLPAYGLAELTISWVKARLPILWLYVGSERPTRHDVRPHLKSQHHHIHLDR